MTTDREPLIQRIPPWQPAALFLVASACAAFSIYGHPSLNVRMLTILVGIAAVVSAIAATRMFLVVDEDGISVRRMVVQHFIAWEDVASASLATLKHGSMTIRISRRDHSFVDVPPALLQPTMPTRNKKAAAKLGRLIREIDARRLRHST